MLRIVTSLFLALTAIAGDAFAETRYTNNRQSQALECGVLLFGAAVIGRNFGSLGEQEASNAMSVAFLIAKNHLGLTEGKAERVFLERFEKRSGQLSPYEFMQYWERTAPWCHREFVR